MAVRPPRPRRPARRPNRVRDLPIVVAISLALVAFWLRSILSLLSVETWLAGWKLIDALTTPVIGLLQAVPLLDTTVIGRMTVADLFATGGATLFALLGLASLSIRRAAR